MADESSINLELLQRQVASLQRENHTLRGNGSDGGNPPGGTMEPRISNLEQGMTEMKVAVGKIETRLEHIEGHMLTKGQMAVYALMALLCVLGGGWWIVQQYLAPILAAAQ